MDYGTDDSDCRRHVAVRLAAVCQDLGGPDSVSVREWPRQPLGPGELRVRIHACGLNFPDVLMTRGQYQLKVPPPFVLGMEAAGIIEELGDGVSGFVRGDAVVANVQYGL